MSTSLLDPPKLIDVMHAAFRVRDLDAIADRWAADVVYGAPGVRLQGRAARKLDEKIWLDAFSDNTVEVLSRYVIGDEVIDFCVMGGLHTGDLALPGGGALAPKGTGSKASTWRAIASWKARSCISRSSTTALDCSNNCRAKTEPAHLQRLTFHDDQEIEHEHP